jgi:hypothetical protein
MVGTQEQRTHRGVGLTSKAHSTGRLAVVLAILAIIWYLLAEFILWGSARASGQQPPAVAWFSFLALVLGTLISGIAGLLMGLIARFRTTVPEVQRRALLGAAYGIAGILILFAFLALAIPRIEG